MLLATLVAMLSSWAADGKPIYSTMTDGLTIPYVTLTLFPDPGSWHGETIRYISHIGAEGLKPLFIAGCAVTGVFLNLGLLSERWLRHSGQLAPNKGKFDKSCAVGSIIFSFTGALGLLLLSIFDVKHHDHLHYGFVIMFMWDYVSLEWLRVVWPICRVSYVVNAILVCLEYIRIGRFYGSQIPILLVSFYIKALFVVLEIGVAIGFGISMKSTASHTQNAAAVLEWGKSQVSIDDATRCWQTKLLPSFLHSTSSPSSLIYCRLFVLAGGYLKGRNTPIQELLPTQRYQPISSGDSSLLR